MVGLENQTKNRAVRVVASGPFNFRERQEDRRHKFWRYEPITSKPITAQGEKTLDSHRAAATKFTPLHDRILVRRLEEAATSGLIIVPDAAKEKPQEGQVVSVGKGRSNDEGIVFPLDVKAGDKILFGKYSGTEIKIDGEEFLIMREEEVLGIVE
jgi:chaperonin GroES